MQIATYNILLKAGKGHDVSSTRIVVKYGDCHDTGRDKGY